MFWKKKTNNKITIDLDSDDRRHGVRIKPLDDIIIKHESYHSDLIDISAIGLSFKAAKADLYKRHDGLDVSVMLPDTQTKAAPVIHCTIKFISIVKTNYHCQIIQIDRHNQNILDHFILNEQKRQIHLHSQ